MGMTPRAVTFMLGEHHKLHAREMLDLINVFQGDPEDARDAYKSIAFPPPPVDPQESLARAAEMLGQIEMAANIRRRAHHVEILRKLGLFPSAEA
jgi:hypothetical protein